MGDTVSVVVPTRFSDPKIWDLLDSIRQAGLSPVIVHTEHGHPDVPDAVNVLDTRRNIHCWWNTGLDLCGDRALVLNDDLTAPPSGLRTMFDALNTADLVHLTGSYGWSALTGFCFGLRPDVIRPDEDFTWWFGDTDLHYRAMSAGLAITILDDTGIVEDRQDKPAYPLEFDAAVRLDRNLFHDRWG